MVTMYEDEHNGERERVALLLGFNFRWFSWMMASSIYRLIDWTSCYNLLVTGCDDKARIRSPCSGECSGLNGSLLIKAVYMECSDDVKQSLVGKI